jgi:hypothetical protein
MIEAELQVVLDTLTEHDFQGAFKKRQKCWERWIRVVGDYFKGDSVGRWQNQSRILWMALCIYRLVELTWVPQFMLKVLFTFHHLLFHYRFINFKGPTTYLLYIIHSGLVIQLFQVQIYRLKCNHIGVSLSISPSLTHARAHTHIQAHLFIYTMRYLLLSTQS